MPIAYTAQSMLAQLVWESANFATGGGATTLAFNLATVDLGTATVAAEAIAEAWDDHLKPLIDNEITLAEVKWETANLSGGVAVGTAGTRSAAGPPSNVATIASYYAVTKGPRSRGRNFWPGMINETEVDERGVITTTRVNAIAAALDSFFSDVDDAPDVVGQAISQSTYPGQASSPLSPWPSVVSRVVQPVIGTQRRRVRP